MKNCIQIAAMLLLALGGASGMLAQNAQGGISKQQLEKWSKAVSANPSDKALRNAIVANGMFFMNADKSTYPDGQFSHRVESKGISDQQRSGRCWLFTGMNVMRADMMARNDMGEFFFSHNYNYFYDQLEKCNLFLQGIIDTRQKPMDDKMVEWLFKHPLNDGGQFTGVSDNIMKYGLVPAEVMPETKNSNNTDALNRILSRMLRQTGMKLRAEKGSAAKLQSIKEDALGKIYRLLVLNLGQPPTEFEWSLRDSKGNIVSTERYTPQSFYQRYVGANLKDDFVMLMNDPSRPYYKLFEIDFDRHAYDGKNWTYVNLPMEDIKAMAIASIKDSTMMYYSCDVGRELNRDKGVMALDNFDYASLLGEDFTMSKKERIQSFDSGSTHAMTLMAVDLDANGKPTKWMVENSWGPTNGYKGHLIMTDDWFDAYTFRIVVDKKYVTDKVLEILKTTPTRLPAWDPMFAPEL